MQNKSLSGIGKTIVLALIIKGIKNLILRLKKILILFFFAVTLQKIT